jgi:iron(III) transport system ATP-binding protein
VTHDPEEALFMSERIAVMRDGRIEQCGDPKELYDCPASPYVTRFFSEINELTGISRGGQVETSLGKVDAKGLADGCNALVMARPEHLLVGQAAVATGHSVEGQVNFARWLGRNAMVEIRLPSGEMIMARTPDQLPLEVGASLEVALDPTRAHCFARTDDKDNLPMINADHAERLALTASLG